MAKWTLMNLVDARQKIYKLVLARALTWQMVPRSADRAPARALYVMRRDPHFARHLMDLGIQYQLHATTLMRRMREATNYVELCEMLSRRDVQQDPSLVGQDAQNFRTTYEHALSQLEKTRLQVDNTVRLLSYY